MLKLVTRDEDDVMPLAELKLHLRIDTSDDDDLIRSYLAAAVDTVERETSRILQPNVYEWRLDCWPLGGVTLPLPVGPVRDVLTVTYVDSDGEEQTVTNDYWDWEPSDAGGDFWFSADFSFPELGRALGGVRIGFEAGHDTHAGTGSSGDASLLIPRLAKPCLMGMVAHWYQNRETAADKALSDIPLGSTRLIQRLRIYR